MAYFDISTFFLPTNPESNVVSVVVVVVVNWPIPNVPKVSAFEEYVTSTAVSPSPPTPINKPVLPSPVAPYFVVSVVVVVVVVD